MTLCPQNNALSKCFSVLFIAKFMNYLVDVFEKQPKKRKKKNEKRRIERIVTRVYAKKKQTNFF